MIEFILTFLLAPFVLLGGVILLSDGECYECGTRLEGGRHTKLNGKNVCDDCWVKGG